MYMHTRLKRRKLELYFNRYADQWLAVTYSALCENRTSNCKDEEIIIFCISVALTRNLELLVPRSRAPTNGPCFSMSACMHTYAHMEEERAKAIGQSIKTVTCQITVNPNYVIQELHVL